ncbi:MAG: glycosyltransferase [Clostridium sp.]
MDKPITRYINTMPKLTLSMVVKNEEGRYLKSCLEKAREYIDNAVIIDDGSTDNTVEIIKNALDGIPLTLILNKTSTFATEGLLRKQQWDETIKTNPDWILFLDGDEIFEDNFKFGIRTLLENQEFDCYNFRLYDMWDEEYYRSDRLWYAHRTFRPFLIRYQKNFEYKFNYSNQHCGRMPNNVMELLSCNCNYRLKHYGWAREEDRIKKYERYKTLDKDGVYGNMEQYESILDKDPKLEKWVE